MAGFDKIRRIINVAVCKARDCKGSVINNRVYAELCTFHVVFKNCALCTAAFDCSFYGSFKFINVADKTASASAHIVYRLNNLWELNFTLFCLLN